MAKKRSKANLIIGGAGAAVAATGLLHLTTMLTLDRIVEYKKAVVASPKIHKSLDGYKICFISDTHFIEREKFRKIVERIDKEKLDVLLLGGDFSEESEMTKNQLVLISEVETADGIYAVDGNHDDPEFLFKEMQRLDISPLPNKGRHLRQGLYLGGVEDFRRRKPDIDLALSEAGEDDFVILLSHNPDIAAFHDTEGIDLMLCGHTHGGHANIFGAFSPMLQMISKTGQKYRAGWSDLPAGGKMFVSNGLGIHHNLPRVFSRPQVVLFTLQSK